MMGPLAYSDDFGPGALVRFTADVGNRIGTVIDNFVNVDLEDGHRTEQALVLWPEDSIEWVSIRLLTVVNSSTEETT